MGLREMNSQRIFRHSKTMAEEETTRELLDLAGMTDISETTGEWLSHWLTNGADASQIPEGAVEELASFRPEEPIRLYRAEVTFPYIILPGEVSYSGPSSWAYDYTVAQDFAEGGRGPIITTLVDPDQVLVDTTLLPEAFMSNFEGQEVEVILLAGTYEVEVATGNEEDAY